MSLFGELWHSAKAFSMGEDGSWDERTFSATPDALDFPLVQQSEKVLVFEVPLKSSGDFYFDRANEVEELTRQYPGLSEKMAEKLGRAFFFFPVASEDEIELSRILNRPVCEGAAYGTFALCSDDVWLPLSIRWAGSSTFDLKPFLQEALDIVCSRRSRVRVPAPDLGSVEDYLIFCRTEEAASRYDHGLVDQILCSQSSTVFLECMSRLYPWMSRGPATWMDKNTALADRLWDLKNSVPGLDKPNALRLAPWKTALADPPELTFFVRGGMGSLQPSQRLWVTRDIHGRPVVEFR